MMRIRILWGIFMGICVAVAFWQSFGYEQDVAEQGFIDKKHPGRTTQIWFSPLIVPMFYGILLIMAPFTGHGGMLMEYMLELLVDLVFLLAIYDLLLLLMLPLLRRIISARACATLWLLPVFLYWMRHIWEYSFVEPLAVIRIPILVRNVLLILWAVGFLAVVIWHIVSHYRFRHRVLLYARPVRDPSIRQLWDREQALIERKKPIPLEYSPDIASPMTIGLFSSSMHTLLPVKSYSEEELQLILRHELRHVQRRDVDTKVFLVFCKAVCWFNPLIWIAARRASEDLEISCDEMVLHQADEHTRKQYASLLLDTASDARGFSTCLTASARSLRGRLKQIMNPRIRFSGTLILGLVTILLVMVSGLFVVTAKYGMLGEIVFRPDQVNGIGMLNIREKDGTEHNVYAYDEKALVECLASLPATRLGVMNESLQEGTQGLYLVLQTDKGLLWLDFEGEYLTVKASRGDGAGLYRLEEPVDLEELKPFLDFSAVNPDPPPAVPLLDLWFDRGEPDSPTAEEPISANYYIVSRKDDTGDRTPQGQSVSWGGIGGFDVKTVELEFSYAPEEWHIMVEGLNGEEPYTVQPFEKNCYVLELPPYSARYTVHGFFASHRNTVYEMEFYFEVSFPEKSLE